MRTVFSSFRTSLPGIGALLFLLFLLTSLANASDYGRDVGGNFDDPVWTRDAPGDADYATDVGPPGAGDTAAMSGGAVTATGGSVQKLSSTVDFIVAGDFFAGSYVSSATLQGGGTLTTNDIGPGVTVQGGNLNIPGTCMGSVALNGGTFHAGTFSAYDLSITAGGNATIDSATTDLNASAVGGSTITVPSIKNGLDITLKIADAGSSITTTGGVSITTGFLDISAGGTFKVGGQLTLDGGKDVDGDNIGGGGSAVGKGTFVSANVIVVGEKAPAPGFGFALEDGAVLSTNAGFIGYEAGADSTMSMSGAGTIWHSNTNGLAVGDSGEGELTMDTGAQLQFGGGVFGVGVFSGGRGSLTADGTGTLIDARQAEVSFGRGAGSQGSVILSNGASLLLTKIASVGFGGNGGLSVGSGSQVSGAALSTFVIGAQAGSAGSVSVEDAGSAFVVNDDANVVIGAEGSGFFGVGNGGTVRTGSVAVANNTTASGQIVADGAGSNWTTTHVMGVGGIPNDKLRGPASVTVQNGAQMRVGTKNASVLFISPTGQVILDGTGKFAVGAGAFGAGGTLRVSAPGILQGQGKQSGTTVYNTNVTGKVIVGAGGKFQPGGDPDVFSIKGDCDLSDGGAGGGETDFELGGMGTAGVNYDQLVVSGKATLSGTLRLVLLPGYVPKVGDQFSLVNAGSVVGGFAQVIAPGLTVNPVPVGGKLNVTVTAVSPMDLPVVTSVTTASGVVGADFSYQIAATNTPGGYTATGLPEGLDLDPGTGLITGVPTTAGTYQVAVSATNVAGTGTASLALTVQAASANGVPTITSELNVSAQLGKAFSYQITATDTPTSYAATGIPANLVLDAKSGLLSGSILQPGVYTLTLEATNAKGTGKATLTLTVAAATPTVTIVVKGDGMAVEGGENGKVFIERTGGDTSTPLTVFYKAKGSAKQGTDIKPLAGSATIPAGASKVKVKIKPINDDVHDGTLKVKLRLLAPGDGSYLVGDPAVAKIKVIDND